MVTCHKLEERKCLKVFTYCPFVTSAVEDLGLDFIHVMNSDMMVSVRGITDLQSLFGCFFGKLVDELNGLNFIQCMWEIAFSLAFCIHEAPMISLGGAIDFTAFTVLLDEFVQVFFDKIFEHFHAQCDFSFWNQMRLDDFPSSWCNGDTMFAWSAVVPVPDMNVDTPFESADLSPDFFVFIKDPLLIFSIG